MVSRYDHKTWTSDNWNHARDMVRWVVLHAAPYIRKSIRSENTQGSLQSRIPGSNNETQGRFPDGLDSNIVVQHSVGTIITLHGRITAREYVDRLVNRVHPIIQNLIPNNDAVFQEDNARWNCSVMVWKAGRWTSRSSLASTITRFEYHWITLVSFGVQSEEQIPISNISKATWRCFSRRFV
jgi:hypothetical protein